MFFELLCNRRLVVWLSMNFELFKRIWENVSVKNWANLRKQMLRRLITFLVSVILYWTTYLKMNTMMIIFILFSDRFRINWNCLLVNVKCWLEEIKCNACFGNTIRSFLKNTSVIYRILLRKWWVTSSFKTKNNESK